LNTPIAPGTPLHLAMESDGRNMQTDLVVAGK
jgi:fimbrial chaperone protein